MTNTQSSALETALAYFEAWRQKDLEGAMAYIHPDIVCDAPAGRINGAEEYRAFMEPFVGFLINAELIGSFGDESKALLMYNTETIPVKKAPGAECVTVVDGKITRSNFIFDQLPFAQAQAQVPF